MHDHLAFHPNPLKKAYQFFTFWRHYGRPFFGHDIGLIAVNNHEADFIRPFRLGMKIDETVIPNGVDFLRINLHRRTAANPFTFLVYGGRNSQKRVDIVFEAGEMLANVIGGDFIVIVTKGTDTEDVAKHYFGGSLPRLAAPRRSAKRHQRLAWAGRLFHLVERPRNFFLCHR